MQVKLKEVTSGEEAMEAAIANLNPKPGPNPNPVPNPNPCPNSSPNPKPKPNPNQAAIGVGPVDATFKVLLFTCLLLYHSLSPIFVLLCYSRTCYSITCHVLLLYHYSITDHVLLKLTLLQLSPRRSRVW